MDHLFLHLLKKSKSVHCFKCVLTVLYIIIFHVSGYAQCPITFKAYASANSQTGADLTVLDTTAGTKTFYVEYGLSGFTPGTNANPGVGGTVVTLTTSATNGIATSVTGLTPSTNYDMYTRKNCSGVFSANSPKQTFYTFYDCSSATPLPCGQNVTPVFTSGNGAWNLKCNGTGREKYYSFTPSVTGNQVLTLNPSSFISTFYWSGNFGTYCNAGTWNCIGSNNSSTATSFNLYLTAGTSYLLLAKPNSTTGGTGGSFRLDCACSPPTNINISNITQYSAIINFTGSGDVVEIGTNNFTPGTGATAGVGGTVYSGYSGRTFTGLTPGTSYAVYTRSLCQGGNIYSSNSAPVYFTTLPCPQIYNYTTMGLQLTIQSYWGQHQDANTLYSCNGDSLQYSESFIKFTPATTGMYKIEMNVSDFDYFFGYRASNNTCNFSNFNYVCPTGNSNDPFTIGPLTAGVTYDLLYEAVDIYGTPAGITITCGDPVNLNVTNIQTNSATLNFSCSCPNNSYIEYGPFGFTPGTGATAGGGTLVTGTSPYLLTGLTENTRYDIYVRNLCGVNNFSQNIELSFRTLIDCANAPVATCGSPFTYSLGQFETGNWNSYGCGPGTNSGNEKIYRFTPAQSGAYKIRATQNYGWQLLSNVFYKPAGGNCDATGWTCLGTLTNVGDSTTTGLLTANTPYLLLFDAPAGGSFYTRTYQIDCSVACSSAPTTPGTITGISKPCPGDTGIIYSIAAINGATIYNWSVPAGATITQGNGTTTIKVNYSSAFINGTIQVTAGNACGTSIAKTKSVSRNIPATPTAISGAAFGLCGGVNSIYSITSVPNATTYLWTVPSGAIIINGQGTTSVTVTFPANFISGTIAVKAGTTCGYGTARALVIKAKPATPASITGPITACAHQSGVIYSTASIPGATSYTWTVPTGGSITSGQGTNSIVMKFGTAGGNIKVKAINSCGVSSNDTLPVAIVCREGISTANNLLDVNIYPNPSANYFTVDAHFATEGNYNLIVRDILGRVVEIYSNINYQQSFNFGKTLHTGIYFVEVSKGDERQVLRIVKCDN